MPDSPQKLSVYEQDPYQISLCQSEMIPKQKQKKPIFNDNKRELISQQNRGDVDINLSFLSQSQCQSDALVIDIEDAESDLKMPHSPMKN